jgi:hypothetical protein
VEDKSFDDFQDFLRLGDKIKRLNRILADYELQHKLVCNANSVSLRLDSRDYHYGYFDEQFNNAFGNESKVVRTIILDPQFQLDILKIFEEKIAVIKDRILEAEEEECNKSVEMVDSTLGFPIPSRD